MYLLGLWIKFMDLIGRRRIILDRESDEPYLERYYMFLKDRVNFPFNIFIHKFLKSDPDDLHDHPWGFTTFIIAGGYWEYITQTHKIWRAPFTYRTVNDPKFLHRIELDKCIPYCWTLFIPHKKVRDWGFIRNGKWIQNEEYFRIKKQEKKSQSFKE